MLKIKEEYRSLIPPLTDEEFELLKANCIEYGIREPISVSEGFIIDGHNRYKIATENDLEYYTVEYDFDSEYDRIDWILINQLGRRNLNETQKDYLIGKRQINEKLKPWRPVKGSKSWTLKKTAEKLADEYGIGTSSVYNNANFAAGVDKTAPELKDKILAGKAKVTKQDIQTIAKAEPLFVASSEDEILKKAKEIRLAKAEVRKEQNNEIRKIKAVMPEGFYGVIVIDPPWEMEKIQRDVAPDQVDFDYPTMNYEEIKELKIPAGDHCHLFCWTTHKHLPATLNIIDAWGFKYVLTMTWHKNGGFQPYNLPQYNSEFVIYARKGSPEFSDTKQFFTCFEGKRREHSRKPDEFYEVIFRVTEGLKRIDIFSREKRNGWEQFGNETQKFTTNEKF